MLQLITRPGEGTTEDGPTTAATLDELARAGAQRMIEAALRLEVEEYTSRGMRRPGMRAGMPRLFATARPAPAG